MTDETDNYEGQQTQNGKKKGGETTSTGSVRKPSVSAAAQQVMQARGFSIQQITEMLRNWKYLDVKEVAARMVEFGKNAKASAHVVVSFAQNRTAEGFTLVTEFLQQCRKLADMVRQLSPEARQMMRTRFSLD